VSHSTPPSRDSTLRRSRAHMGPAGPPLQTGPPGPPLQRDLLHAALDRKQRSQRRLHPGRALLRMDPALDDPGSATDKTLRPNYQVAFQ
jgi:hypothetical protein